MMSRIWTKNIPREIIIINADCDEENNVDNIDLYFNRFALILPIRLSLWMSITIRVLQFLSLAQFIDTFWTGNKISRKIVRRWKFVITVGVSVLSSPLSQTNRDVDSMQIARMRLREGSIGHSASP